MLNYWYVVAGSLLSPGLWFGDFLNSQFPSILDRDNTEGVLEVYLELV